MFHGSVYIPLAFTSHLALMNTLSMPDPPASGVVLASVLLFDVRRVLIRVCRSPNGRPRR